MGKSFEKELEVTTITYEKVLKTNVDILKNYLNKIFDEDLVLIGSGGSFSVASALEYFLRRWCKITKSITPFSIEAHANQISKVNFILLTAGGRNPDSINSYKFISDLEPCNLLTVCMNENAPIKKIQKNNLHNHYFEFKLPNEKDGFLAVNSLLATIALFSKAMFELTQDNFFRLNEIPDFVNEQNQANELELVLSKETLIVLHGGMTSPIAIDFESKFSETALGNVQLVDYRNFAHGRHFWLSERSESTSIIAFISINDVKIASKTLNLIPNGIPILKYFVQEDNINGMLKAYYDMFLIVSKAGKFRNIDPGRPKIPDYGRKMYHISHNACSGVIYKNLVKSEMNASVYRKIGLGNNETIFNKYKVAFLKFYESLRNNEFRGIIFDYDGTLHYKNMELEIESEIFSSINFLLSKNILVGIATGRGKSVRLELRKVIERKYWNSVTIAYYNGACIGTLNNDYEPNNKVNEATVLEEIYSKISKKRYFEDLEIKLNPYQITLFFNNSNNYYAIQNIKEEISGFPEVKLLTSSHSIDIVLCKNSKRKILNYYWELDNTLSDNDFLLIGDSGNLNGNDFELLHSSYGLSVDKTSKDLEYCWNIATLGLRNLEATKYYLEQISCIELDKFRLNFKKG